MQVGRSSLYRSRRLTRADRLHRNWSKGRDADLGSVTAVFRLCANEIGAWQQAFVTKDCENWPIQVRARGLHLGLHTRKQAAMSQGESIMCGDVVSVGTKTRISCCSRIALAKLLLLIASSSFAAASVVVAPNIVVNVKAPGGAVASGAATSAATVQLSAIGDVDGSNNSIVLPLAGTP